MEAVREETGADRAFLAGHSLGGTLAAIYASLHPQRVRGMIALEAPIAFGAGPFEAAAAVAPPSAAITRPFGNMPGSYLDMASVAADPLTFNAEPFTDWLRSSVSAEARRLHWQVRRWTLDETPMAQRLFEEVDEALYRSNRFARGELRIAGLLADPRAIEAPIVAVLDRRSRIVPPASIEAYRTHTGSKDVEILEYAGDTGVVVQHVGVLVGPSAHAHLWPRICGWARSRV
jgi:polyhydroxyalkanoate synthase